jgi:hypothetical protein
MRVVGTAHPTAEASKRRSKITIKNGIKIRSRSKSRIWWRRASGAFRGQDSFGEMGPSEVRSKLAMFFFLGSTVNSSSDTVL